MDEEIKKLKKQIGILETNLSKSVKENNVIIGKLEKSIKDGVFLEKEIEALNKQTIGYEAKIEELETGEDKTVRPLNITSFAAKNGVSISQILYSDGSTKLRKGVDSKWINSKTAD